jgi:hypothetical protein
MYVSCDDQLMRGNNSIITPTHRGESTKYTECQSFSPVVRIGSPAPSPASECCPPTFGSKGGAHSLGGEGAGGANSDEGSDTLVP